MSDELPEITMQPVAAESRDAKSQRMSVGVLLLVIGAFLVYLTLNTSGSAVFALSNAFDDVQLPSITVPGVITVAIAAIVTLVVGWLYVSGKLPKRHAGWIAALAGIAVIVGILVWGAAGRSAPFTLTNQFNGALAVATPLVFGALCGVLSERAGVVNVAIEGQMLTAAFTAVVVGSMTGSVIAALIAAMVAAVLMSVLLAFFAIKYLVDQVVLGVVINLFASGMTGFIFDQVVQPNSTTLNQAPILQTIPIPLLSDIPFFGPVLFNQTILAYLAAISVVLVWFLIFRTKWGLRVRAVGEHPEAADTVGINVHRTQWSAVLVGGLFAGLGGAYFTLGVTGSFNKDITVGFGFIALAAVIMGRWNPILAAIVALFFGFVRQLALQFQSIGTPVPSQLLQMLPYLATIIAVAGLVGRVRAPAHDGVPYVKE